MLGTLLSLSLAAASVGEPRSAAAIIDDLARCLEIASSTDRAACLERTAHALVDAERREQRLVSGTPEQRFGLPAGQIPNGGSHRMRLPTIDRLDGVLVHVNDIGAGLYNFSLADGSRWVTQEAGLFEAPQAGQSVVIRRGALGSYRVTFAGQRSVQAQRSR